MRAATWRWLRLGARRSAGARRCHDVFLASAPQVRPPHARCDVEVALRLGARRSAGAAGSAPRRVRWLLGRRYRAGASCGLACGWRAEPLVGRGCPTAAAAPVCVTGTETERVRWNANEACGQGCWEAFYHTDRGFATASFGKARDSQNNGLNRQIVSGQSRMYCVLR
jgi:hypothetical protein